MKAGRHCRPAFFPCSGFLCAGFFAGINCIFSFFAIAPGLIAFVNHATHLEAGNGSEQANGQVDIITLHPGFFIHTQLPSLSYTIAICSAEGEKGRLISTTLSA